jgi:GntR family transcriptional regulator/MocR family aminotransferase
MGQTEPVGDRELLLEVVPGAGPLHEQLERALREQVRSGRLAPGARVPSSRALARRLGVSRGVVLEAYDQLVAEGYLETRQGAPTQVAPRASGVRVPLAAESLGPRYAYRFDAGLPDLAALPREAWLRSVRTAWRKAPYSALAPSEMRGTPELRNALLEYLGRARGAAPEPEHTVVCAGFAQAFGLICACLAGRGIERIAFEDPGFSPARLVGEHAGLTGVEIPVDAQGLDVESLAASDCEAVVVTPAHQFPTGAVMSSERRSALLDWAEEREALIIEDDYDSELRLDRGAIGALQGVAPERVCLIGTSSKRLMPGLRLGWMLCPSWLTGEITLLKGLSDGGTPVIEQLALADFILRGELDRHLRRMRTSYRRRREAMLEALASAVPAAQPVGVPGGLYTLVTLPSDVSEAAVLRAAAGAGVWIEGLSAHQRRGEGPVGLLLGYASQPEPALVHGIERLGGALGRM